MCYQVQYRGSPRNRSPPAADAVASNDLIDFLYHSLHFNYCLCYIQRNFPVAMDIDCA